MKRITKLFLLVMLMASFNLSAQLTELALSPDSVFCGASHYTADDGNQRYPGAQVDDPFSYDPNNPMAEYPFQAWKSFPDFSYYFLRAGKKEGRDVTLSDYPDAAQDSNFYSVTFTIPEGKQIRYIDFWGQSEPNMYSESLDLVIILNNDGARWVYRNWDGITKMTDPDKGYARFDVKGITDNLNKSATQFTVTRTSQRNRMRIAEFRIALEDNPSVGDNDAPILSGMENGDLVENNNIVGQCNEEATIYLVPQATYSDIVDVQKAAIKKLFVEANTEFSFSTTGIELGAYQVVALDGNNNMTVSSDVVNVIADVVAPVVSGITDQDIPVSTWVSFSADERGRAYLVPTGTAADSISVTAAAVAEAKLDSAGMFYMQTYGIQTRTYVVYAIDLVGNLSAASSVLKVVDMPPYTGIQNLALTNAVLLGARYSEKFNLGEYALTDAFAYDATNPTADAPQQGWVGGDNVSHCFANGKTDEVSWEADFALSAGKALYAIDVWGRKWAGAPDGDIFDPSSSDDYRTNHLMVTLSNADSSLVWSTPADWDGVSAPADGAFGRLIFTTAGAPKDLLTTASHVKIWKNMSDIFFLHIDEVRMVESDPYNNRPVANAGVAQTVAPGATVTLDGSASSDADGDVLTYSWRGVSNTIALSDAKVVKPTFTAPQEAGDYTFSLTVNDGAVNSTRSTVVVTVDPNASISTAKALSVSVYPNPSSQGFLIDMKSMKGMSQVTVYDISGKTMMNKQTLSNDTYSIDANTLGAGVYFLKISNGGKTYMQRLIAE